MTDFEKVYDLLKYLGVEFAVTSIKGRNGKSIQISDAYDKEGYVECEVITGDPDKIKCCNGFYTYYRFDDNGKFEIIGIYE
jgi:hypothetical protein